MKRNIISLLFSYIKNENITNRSVVSICSYKVVSASSVLVVVTAFDFNACPSPHQKFAYLVIKCCRVSNC